MSTPTILGFAGDILTFAGGLILSLDAILRGNEFRKTNDLQKTVAQLHGINLVDENNLRIFDNESVELSFIRRSVRRALWGTMIITGGFLCLLATRVLEALAEKPLIP